MLQTLKMGARGEEPTDSGNVREFLAIRKHWEASSPNDTIDFGLSLLLDFGPANHGKHKARGHAHQLQVYE